MRCLFAIRKLKCKLQDNIGMPTANWGVFHLPRLVSSCSFISPKNTGSSRNVVRGQSCLTLLLLTQHSPTRYQLPHKDSGSFAKRLTRSLFVHLVVNPVRSVLSLPSVIRQYQSSEFVYPHFQPCFNLNWPHSYFDVMKQRVAKSV